MVLEMIQVHELQPLKSNDIMICVDMTKLARELELAKTTDINYVRTAQFIKTRDVKSTSQCDVGYEFSKNEKIDT